jgi:hypothetical protein
MGSFSDDLSERFMVFVVNKELACIIAKSVLTAKSKNSKNSPQS